MTNTQIDAKPFFQLVVGDGNSVEVENAIVPVRWCLNEVMLREIISSLGRIRPNVKIEEFYIGLTVSHPTTSLYDDDVVYKELSRAIVPLKDGMTYVTINRPGKFIIYASILLPRKIKQVNREIKKALTRSSSGRLEHEIGGHYYKQDEEVTLGNFVDHCWSDCEIVTGFIGVNNHLRYHLNLNPTDPNCTIQFAIDGTCPPELFSSITPGWFTNWVNYGCESKVVDQCSFRRRLIVWALVKSWVVPCLMLCAVTVATIVGLLALFIGYNFIDFKKLFEFDEIPTRDIGWNDNLYVKHPVALIAHPVSWPFWYITYDSVTNGSIARAFSAIWNWITSFSVSWESLGIVALLVASCVGMYTFVKVTYEAFELPDQPTKLWGNIPSRLYNWIMNRSLRRQQEIMKNISCGGDPMKFATAPKPTSVKLIAKSIKSKVCKPMSL